MLSCSSLVYAGLPEQSRSWSAAKPCRLFLHAVKEGYTPLCTLFRDLLCMELLLGAGERSSDRHGCDMGCVAVRIFWSSTYVRARIS